MQIKPLSERVGAEISGVNLAADLSGDTFEKIDDAYNRYSVLVFRDQKLTPEQQIAFARSFGELEISVPGGTRPKNYQVERRLSSHRRSRAPSRLSSYWPLPTFAFSMRISSRRRYTKAVCGGRINSSGRVGCRVPAEPTTRNSPLLPSYSPRRTALW